MEVKCTPYSTTTNCIIKKIYEPTDDIMLSYIIPTIFIITMVSYIINLYIKTQILEGKQDWATNMCIPKYMFISGLINSKPGENPLLATSANFKQCVRQFKDQLFNETYDTSEPSIPDVVSKPVSKPVTAKLNVPEPEPVSAPVVNSAAEAVVVDTPDRTKVINNFKKLLLALNVNIPDDQFEAGVANLSTEQLIDKMSSYVSQLKMTQSQFDNATVEEIKHNIAIVGRENLR